MRSKGSGCAASVFNRYLAIRAIASTLCLKAVLLGLLLPALAVASSGRTILIFGDSLSTGYGIELKEGWVSLLERRLTRDGFEYRVVNASISGETTRGGRVRVDEALDAAGPGIVIVELGGNDGLRGIDLASTEDNLESIVKSSVEAGAEVLLLAMELPPNYGPSYIQRFRQIYLNIAKANGVHLVPFFLEGVARDPALMQDDGIHPKAEAQPRLLENIWPYLEPLLSR